VLQIKTSESKLSFDELICGDNGKGRQWKQAERSLLGSTPAHQGMMLDA
jgi:hypothetical protein